MGSAFQGPAVASVANSDGTLTISPTTGGIIASLALSHPNTWTGQQIIKGTTTNDSASTGNIGEYITASLSSAGAASLTNNTPLNITSASLTAGDWDVSGVANFSTSGASASDFKSGTNSVSATFGAENTSINIPLVATGLSDILSEVQPTTRYSISATTTVYLIAQATFSLGSITVYGTIRGRRIR